MLGDLLERNADGGVAVLVTPWHMAVQHVGLVPPHDSLVSCRVDWNVLTRWYTGESKNLSGTHGEAIIVDLISC
jgi:hypothetical protein